MWKRHGKRCFDLFICVIACPVLVPLLSIASLSIWLTMGRPALFRQHRTGVSGEIFVLWKFRSMRNAYDENGNLLPDAVRMTKTGRFIRSLSVDELPSFWNLLRGELTLIGPRPLLPQYLDRYTAEQSRRHLVVPGITGWAQVNGRNSLKWEDRFVLDVWYVDNLSFSLDMKIFFMTLKKIFARDGISHPGEATMHEFMGSAIARENRSLSS